MTRTSGECATTSSTPPARSACATADACSTSASAGPTPAQRSSASSTTTTPPSSTPTPEKSSPNTPSRPPAPTNEKTGEPPSLGVHPFTMSFRHHSAEAVVSGFRTSFRGVSRHRCGYVSRHRSLGVPGHHSRVWRDIVPDCDNEQERSDHLRDHRSRYVHQRGSRAILALSPLDQSAARALPRRRYRRTRSPVPTPTHQPHHHQRSDPREGYRTAP